MNWDEVIQKHQQWKQEFRYAISSRAQVNLATVGDEGACTMGRWLRSDAASRYGHFVSYAPCVEKHTVFHCEALKVALEINAEHFDEAEDMLCLGTPYTNASNDLIQAIRDLQADVERFCA